MKPLEKLHPPISATSLGDILGLSITPELAMIRLDDLQKMQAAGDFEPANYLTPQELDCYNLFKYEKRQTEWLGGRLCAKKAALEHLSLPITKEFMREWPIFVEENGRPFFRSATHPELSLSISHSHGLASAMVVTGSPCGLDVQKITESTIRVKEKFCTNHEEEILTEFIPPDPGQPATGPTLLWAAKEALRKALGGNPLTGFLAIVLIEIAPQDNSSWIFNLLVGDKSYQIMVFIYQDYAVAMCTSISTNG
jgi:phosphopantetheinyl transferase